MMKQKPACVCLARFTGMVKITIPTEKKVVNAIKQ